MAIARVLLKDSPIVVYDEATSSLDSITENVRMLPHFRFCLYLSKYSFCDVVENHGDAEANDEGEDDTCDRSQTVDHSRRRLYLRSGRWSCSRAGHALGFDRQHTIALLLPLE